MFVVIFFLLGAGLLGTRKKETQGANLIILLMSIVCATALYSFRFA